MLVVKGVAVADEQETKPVFFLLAGEAVGASLLTPLILLPLLAFFGVIEWTSGQVSVPALDWSVPTESFVLGALGIGFVHGLSFAIVEWSILRERMRLASAAGLLAPILLVLTGRFAAQLLASTSSLSALASTLTAVSSWDWFLAGLLAFVAVSVHGPLLVCRSRHGDAVEQCGASAMGALISVPLFTSALAVDIPERIDRAFNTGTFFLVLCSVVFPLCLPLGRRPVYALLRVIEQDWEPVEASDTFTRLRSLWALGAVRDGVLLMLGSGALLAAVRNFSGEGETSFAIVSESIALPVLAHAFVQCQQPAPRRSLGSWPRVTLGAWIALAVLAVVTLYKCYSAGMQPGSRAFVAIAVVVGLCVSKYRARPALAQG